MPKTFMESFRDLAEELAHSAAPGCGSTFAAPA
jgi:hypothetical protein